MDCKAVGFYAVAASASLGVLLSTGCGNDSTRPIKTAQRAASADVPASVVVVSPEPSFFAGEHPSSRASEASPPVAVEVIENQGADSTAPVDPYAEASIAATGGVSRQDFAEVEAVRTSEGIAATQFDDAEGSLETFDPYADEDAPANEASSIGFRVAGDDGIAESSESEATFSLEFGPQTAKPKARQDTSHYASTGDRRTLEPLVVTPRQTPGGGTASQPAASAAPNSPRVAMAAKVVDVAPRPAAAPDETATKKIVTPAPPQAPRATERVTSKLAPTTVAAVASLAATEPSSYYEEDEAPVDTEPVAAAPVAPVAQVPAMETLASPTASVGQPLPVESHPTAVESEPATSTSPVAVNQQSVAAAAPQAAPQRTELATAPRNEQTPTTAPRVEAVQPARAPQPTVAEAPVPARQEPVPTPAQVATPPPSPPAAPAIAAVPPVPPAPPQPPTPVVAAAPIAPAPTVAQQPMPAPMRSPAMVATLAQADERVRHAIQLAEKGAMYASRKEFTSALTLISQARDVEQGTRQYSQATAAGLQALKEANDFVKAGAATTDISRIVASHKTPILKGQNVSDLPPTLAAQHYYDYAKVQLATGIGRETVGSIALYGLGRIIVGGAGPNAQHLEFTGPAMTLYQAALICEPQNFRAAHELGVLLASSGQLELARNMLLGSASASPQPTMYKNLAVVHARLGEQHLAVEAQQRATVLEQTLPAANVPAVQWVDPATFAQVGSSTDPTLPAAPAATPPAPPAEAATPKKPGNVARARSDWNPLNLRR